MHTTPMRWINSSQDGMVVLLRDRCRFWSLKCRLGYRGEHTGSAGSNYLIWLEQIRDQAVSGIDW